MNVNTVRRCFSGVKNVVFTRQVIETTHVRNCSVKQNEHRLKRDDWLQRYQVEKEKAHDVTGIKLINPKAIFANNETDLGSIDVYGFDYDYTLASYTPALHQLIYDLGRESLVSKYRYPDAIMNIKYVKDFSIRGLHYDIQRGLMMKLDSFHNIQLGTVFRGLQQVPDSEVKAFYNGTHVALKDMNTFYGTGPMHQLVDLFAVPEMTLLADVTEFFMQKEIPYDPEYVFYDVRSAVQGVHMSGILHAKIMEDLARYLERGPEITQVLHRLINSNKKLFLITNSGFPFVNAGMKYLIGGDWMELFEVIICNARKPKFFNESSRPFRIYDPCKKLEYWDRVSHLRKDRVYQEGNFNFFRQMTDWHGAKVLYFGDHVYSDLADPSLKHGWKTGAIIPELETEIGKSNSEDFQVAVRWLCVLQELIEEIQVDQCPEVKEILNVWLQERDEIRNFTKSLFNPRFGSIFRTYHNPTYFSRRLARFADMYMSSVVNLLEYPVDHTFYPRRMALPHESPTYGNIGG
ncbi:5'-nucleotidase domain-containing protein 3-like [Ylistrum balloti]|uniref:5'-nucleotidase domain-containing protein 3-like n=1 Tax=Ylistrum balloti TaxID=509963 RepID=UPI00290590AD|nr:5'-nucleotidase domain-containing protein 3-like [Ylistrum balloti]